MSKLPAVLLVVLGLAAAACNQSSGGTAQPVQQPTTPAKPGVPQIPAATMQKVESAYAAATTIAEEGMALLKQGLEIERKDGRQAANDTLLKAKNKLRDAIEMTGQYAEAVPGDPLTQAQIDAYLGAYTKKHGQWIKAMKDIGKVHD